jgi:phosphoribosylanthranilate isomerase
MRVKICGITNYEDAKVACDFGADALGFIFYEKSPRYIEPLKAREIISKLPPFVKKIGVFVDINSCDINQIVSESSVDLSQIHFSPTQDNFYKLLERKYIKVTRAKVKTDIHKSIENFTLIDSFVDGYGGMGVTINLDWFEFVNRERIILAGGIDIDNILKVKSYNFYGVDICSGVEKSKGIKDHELLKKILIKAKS